MADPFRTAPPPSGGFGRALRSKRVTTIEAIEDLFCRCDGLRSVTIEEVHGVGQNHGVELARKFKSDRKHLYRRYLMHCLEDQMLSEEERNHWLNSIPLLSGDEDLSLASKFIKTRTLADIDNGPVEDDEVNKILVGLTTAEYIECVKQDIELGAVLIKGLP